MKNIIRLAILFLALPAMAASVTLSWDAPPGFPVVTNFVIYTSLNGTNWTKALTVTNTTTATVSNLSYSTLWHFVATSKEGTIESVFSNVASTNTPALPAPINLKIGP